MSKEDAGKLSVVITVLPDPTTPIHHHTTTTAMANTTKVFDSYCIVPRRIGDGPCGSVKRWYWALWTAGEAGEAHGPFDTEDEAIADAQATD